MKGITVRISTVILGSLNERKQNTVINNNRIVLTKTFTRRLLKAIQHQRPLRKLKIEASKYENVQRVEQ